MAEIKTKPTAASVEDFINTVQKHEQKTKVHHRHGEAGIWKIHSCQETWGTPVDAGDKP